ncbi:MAG: sugar phosphate isomerase/epimerase family protein [Akkermansiaceae bacterium]
MQRRTFLTQASLAAASTATLLGEHDGEKATSKPSNILLSLKDNMIGEGATFEEKCRLVKDLGYDGIEVHGPNLHKPAEVRAASAATKLPVHGMVNAVHWQKRLSDPSEEKRTESRLALIECLKEISAMGGSSVLLVPGVAGGKVTQKEAWDRSVEQIRMALPTAAQLGIHIIIENVWNGMFYDPKGPNTQTADQLANYIDEINSPWVGSYFDIGNHQRFGKPADWIQTLGKRIVKLDVKDWGIKNSFCNIGNGDVDWPSVRAALKDIGYTGWATAEVRGGKRDRLAEVLKNMQTHLLGS